MIRNFSEHNTAADSTPDRHRVLLAYCNQQLDKRWGVLYLHLHVPELPDLLRSVKHHGLEGLVAKRRDSRYEPGSTGQLTN
jgi:ATP-dependent DNA ligase